MRNQFYLKKVLVLFSVILLVSTSNILIAQVTGSGIFFQAVARDGYSNPAKDRSIVVETSLIQTTVNGTVILKERFTTTTDASGVFGVSLGEGARLGGAVSNFKAIDWSKGPFFLNVQIAIAPIVTSSNWDYTKDLVNLGTSPFGAVPYALFAESVAGFDTKLNSVDTAKMLLPYAKVANLNSLVTNKVNIADSNTTYVTPSQLAAKTFDQTPILNSINTKLNIADSIVKYVTPAQLAAKTFDSTTIYNQLALKANTTDMTTALALKANATDVTTALGLKANATDVTAALGLKANTTDVTTALALKANAADVTTSLGLKENIANKSSDLTVDGSSNTKYPTVKSVKDYVDLQVASSIATIVDASPTVKGKIQLSGDLTGTAALPLLANNAVTTAKIADGNITNAKLATGIDATKITGDISGKAANVTGTVTILNGGTGATSAAAARTNLGLVIGTDVQAPLSFTSPLIKNTNTVSLSQATTSVDGYLSATDFTNFNNKIDATQKAANNGVATLGNDGKIPSNQIPAVSFQSATVVSSQAAMLGLSSAVAGSIAIRTDVNRNFVLSTAPASTLSNWIELATPSSVTSVNGSAGPNVVITTNDISEGANNKYYTDARVRSALSAVSPLSFNTGTGAFSMGAASVSNNGYLSSSDFTTFNNKQNAIIAGTDYLAPNGSAIALTNFPTLNQNTTGNAATATKLAATKNINGVPFDGSASINIDADANTLTGNTLASNVTSSSLTSVGTITAGVWSGTTIAIAKGGTGATSATGALTNLGAEPAANKSNDISTDASSTTKFPSVKAIKDYVDLQSANAGVADNSLTSAKINGTIAITKGGTGASTAAAARTNLGLAIGTDVMAANYTTTLTGDVTGSGNGSFATTVNSVGGVSASTISTFDTRIASNTSSITANTNSIATLNTNVNANTASITANTTSINANTSSITANTNSIATLNTNVNANTASITANTTSINANTASITANTNSIATLNTNVNANTASITSNTNSIATLNTNVNANTSSITAHTTSINANTASITANTNSIATLNTNVNANTASITANTNSIAALNTNVNANTASITAHTTSINANTASITANTNSIATLNTNVNANTASITANTTSINANTASITSNIADILLRAPIASPTFTGTPAAPTAATSDNSTTLATTAYVKANLATVSAGTLTGTTLASTITGSSLTSVGTITSGIWSGTAIAVVNGGTGATTAASALTNLGAEAIANKSTDIAADAASTTKYPSVKTIKDYVDTRVASAAVADGSLTNAKLINSTTILGSTTLTLGGTVTSVTGLSSVSSTGFTGALTGNASTATALATGRTISLTGDVTYTSPAFDGSGDITAAATLAASGVNSGTYGSSTAIPVLTVDTKGRVTSASTVGIIAGVNSLNYTSTTSYAAGGTISGTALTLTAANGSNPGLISTGAQTIAGAKTFNSDVTAPNFIGNLSGNATTATTAGNITATSNTTLTSLTNLATIGTITSGTWSATEVAIAKGGTGATTAADARTNLGLGSLATKSTIANADVASAAAIDFAKLNITKANITSLGVQEGLTAGSGISIASGTISATGLTTSNLSATAGITNAQLANSTTTLGSTTMTLGGTVTSVTGLSSLAATNLSGALSGNATTATTLATSRNINGVAFNGSSDITVTADAGTLTGTTLKSTVTGSSLTSVGTITSGTWSGSVIGSNVGGAGTVSGLMKANGSGVVSAAVAGTDYQAPYANLTNIGSLSNSAGYLKNVGSGTFTYVGSITDADLSTIATAGKVSNTATTATASNTANAIVARDASGNFTAGTISGTLSGTANVANTLTTGRTISTTGDVTYTSTAFDGSANVTGVATLANSGVSSGTYGSATSIPILTVDAKGRLTSAGSSNIIANAGTLTGTTLNATVTSSSLTGVGTITSGTWNGNTITVANGGTGVTTSTGSGNVVLSTSPTLVTPVLGTPTSVTLTNGTGLPIATGVSGLGTGVASFLATPTSANLLNAMTDETGTGLLVFGTSPTLTTPNIGAANGTSLSLTGNLSGAAGTFSSTLSAGASTLTSLVTPSITGGSGTAQSLTYKTTSGVGATGADHIFQVGNNGATEAMRITNSANIGVGTNTPSAKFDVSAGTTTNVTGINLTGSINDFLQFNVQNTSTGNAAQSGYAATADNGTTTTGFAWMGINNSAFNFPATYNIGAANDVTYIGSGQDMHIANANNNKSIIFSTGKSTTPYFNERMRITSTGNVGIGTNSPTTTFEVSGTSRLGGATTIAGAATFTSTVAITTGAGAGKVLTSDASGNASWQTGVTTITTKAASYTITNTDNFIVFTTAGITGQTFTLPTATAAGAGKEFTIKNMSGFSLSVSSTSSLMQEYIASGTYPTTITLGIDASNNWVKVISDGTNWIIFRALF